MNISIKKISILVKRDFKDFFKNPAIFITILVPLFFVFLYKFLFGHALDKESLTNLVLHFGICMNCAMCSVIIPSTSIAEEKEKFTLRTLMLSNVNSMEFLTSKILLGFLVTMVGNILVFLLSGSPMSGFVVFLIASILGSLSLNLISAILGVLSRDQASASVLQIPVMLIILIPTMLGNMNAVLHAIGKFTPIQAMMDIYYHGVEGLFFTSNVLINFIILLIWIVLSVALFTWAYKKRGMDN